MSCDSNSDNTTKTGKDRKVNDYLPNEWKRFQVELITPYRRDLYVSLSREEYHIMNQFLLKHEFEMPKDPEVYKKLPEKVRKVIHNWMQMRN